MADLTLLSSVPPVFEDSIYGGLRPNMVVIVNCGDAEAYHAADGWCDFTNIQEYNGYSLIVESADIMKGTAEIVHAPDCEENSAVIRAVPASQYAFDHWNDGDTTNPRALTVVSDTSFIAYFVYTGVVDTTGDDPEPEGIDDTEAANSRVWSENGCVVVDNTPGQMLTILDVMGRVVVRERAVDNKRYQMPAPGVYMVQTGTAPARKVVVAR